jgi:hypothetical protein
MKGYFSSLAKQSGLRVSGHKSGPRFSSVVADNPLPAPLHREETLMVQPSIDPVRIENSVARRPTKKADSPKPDRQVPSVDIRSSALNKTVPEIVRDNEPANTKAPVKIEAGSQKTPPVMNNRDNNGPGQPAADIASPDNSPDPEIIAVEQQNFVEQHPASTIQIDRPEIPESSQTDAPPAIEPPRFFAKTVEIIERGDPDPAEFGDILFQEVRQWVAGGPPEREAPAHLAQATETLTVREATRTAPEPGTVVIRNSSFQERADGPAALEEQNFTLSIGTISVIIEDPEKPAEPVRIVQNEQSQNTLTSTKREFSRLSRNYL